MQLQNQTLRYQLQGIHNNQYLVLSTQTGWLCHFPSYLLKKKKNLRVASLAFFEKAGNN